MNQSFIGHSLVKRQRCFAVKHGFKSFASSIIKSISFFACGGVNFRSASALTQTTRFNDALRAAKKIMPNPSDPWSQGKWQSGGTTIVDRNKMSNKMNQQDRLYVPTVEFESAHCRKPNIIIPADE